MTADVDPALLEAVRGRLAAAASGGPPGPADVARALRAEGAVLGDGALLAVVAALGSELVGLGPLQRLVEEPGVTDVLVSGPDEVWVERDGRLERCEVRFRDDAAVRALAQRLCAAAGRRLDDAAPFADARLPGGVRLHAALAPPSRRGTCLSLRVPARAPLSLAGLVALGSVTAPVAAVLGRLVAARVSTVVSGGAGTGKTTLLGALLGLVPADERVVVVEDSGELSPAHPHLVLLEGRPPNLEGAGAIGLRELVRQALRMRPDRLVVGEVRGAEVVDLLAALNTGHQGGLCTVHANLSRDVPARLEALALAAGLGRDALHSQLAAGLEAVVHLDRTADGRRRVAEVGVSRRRPDGLVEVVPALSVRGGAPGAGGPGLELLEARLASGRTGRP